MGKMTSTGITLEVGLGEPATYDASGYGAVSVTKIGELTTIPEFGPTISVVESKSLESGKVDKYAGFVDYGSVSLEADFDDDDAGQAIATDAVDKTNAAFGAEHTFKLTYASGAVRYFTGKFFSATENPGSADSMVTTTMSVEINTPILKVTA